MNVCAAGTLRAGRGLISTTMSKGSLFYKEPSTACKKSTIFNKLSTRYRPFRGSRSPSKSSMSPGTIGDPNASHFSTGGPGLRKFPKSSSTAQNRKSCRSNDRRYQQGTIVDTLVPSRGHGQGKRSLCTQTSAYKYYHEHDWSSISPQ